MPHKHARRKKITCRFCGKVYYRQSSLRSHIFHFHPGKLIACFKCSTKDIFPCAGTLAEDAFNEHNWAYHRNMIKQIEYRLNRKLYDKIPKDLEKLEYTVCRSCKGIFHKTIYEETATESGTNDQELINCLDENPQDLQHDNCQVPQNPSDQVIQNPRDRADENPQDLQHDNSQVPQNPSDRADENQRVSPNPRDCANENLQIPKDHQNPDGNPRFPENTRFSQDPWLQPNVSKPLNHDPWFNPWLYGNDNKPLSQDLWLSHGNNPWVQGNENKPISQDLVLPLRNNPWAHGNENPQDENNRVSPNSSDRPNEYQQIPRDRQNSDGKLRIPVNLENPPDEKSRFSDDLWLPPNESKRLIQDPWFSPWIHGNEHKPLSRDPCSVPHAQSSVPHANANPQDEHQRVYLNPRNCPNENAQVPIDCQNQDGNPRISQNQECPPDNSIQFFQDPWRHLYRSKPPSEDPTFKPWVLPNEKKPFAKDHLCFPYDNNLLVRQDASDRREENQSPCKDPCAPQDENQRLHPDAQVQLEVNQRFNRDPWVLKEKNTTIRNPFISKDQTVVQNDNPPGVQEKNTNIRNPSISKDQTVVQNDNPPSVQEESLKRNGLLLHNKHPLDGFNDSLEYQNALSPDEDPLVFSVKKLRIRIDPFYRPAVTAGISLNPVLRPTFNPRICLNPLYRFRLNQSPPGVQEAGLKRNDFPLLSKDPLDGFKDSLEYQNASLSPDEGPLVLPVKNLRIRTDPFYRPAVTSGISLNPMLRPTFNPRICSNPLYRFRLNQWNNGRNLFPYLNGNPRVFPQPSDRHYERKWILSKL